MSSQREYSLDSCLDEVRASKGSTKVMLPRYAASLKGLSQLTDEFGCRFWVCCVEGLVQQVMADYQQYQAQTRKLDMMSMLMTLGINIALKSGGFQPAPPPDSLRVGLSINPSGKIEPMLLDEVNKQPGAVITSYEKFMAIVQRLKEELFKGTIVPTSEAHILKLIYHLAVKSL